jgi:hypothetical protein
MNDEKINYERFRWEKQKFMLVLAVGLMAIMISALMFFWQSQQSLRVEEYANETTSRTLRDYKELEYESRAHRERISILEEKIQRNESLIKSVLDNQKAQESLLKSISERSK